MIKRKERRKNDSDRTIERQEGKKGRKKNNPKTRREERKKEEQSKDKKGRKEERRKKERKIMIKGEERMIQIEQLKDKKGRKKDLKKNVSYRSEKALSKKERRYISYEVSKKVKWRNNNN